jgi:hypothetical protein
LCTAQYDMTDNMEEVDLDADMRCVNLMMMLIICIIVGFIYIVI